MTSQPKLLSFLTIISFLLFIASLGMVFLYAPLEVVMNYVQKIFYFHIANAWVGMLGFIGAAIAGITYLIKKDPKWDIVEVASVEISLIFFFIAIVSGSIWARPSWGTWWTWDARLTTAAILEMIYLAYLMMRQGIEDPDRRARFGAIYTIIGGLSVPVTFLSIRLWQTIHPAIIGSQNPGSSGGFGMTPPMLNTMFFSLFTFSVIFITILWYRIRIGKLAAAIEDLKLKVAE